MDGVAADITPGSAHQEFTLMLFKRLEALEDRHDCMRRAQDAEHESMKDLRSQLDASRTATRDVIEDHCEVIVSTLAATTTACNDLMHLLTLMVTIVNIFFVGVGSTILGLRLWDLICYCWP